MWCKSDDDILPAGSISICSGQIFGPTELCAFTGTANEATYYTHKVTGATLYNWNVPTGATITGHPAGTGVNDTIITVAFAGNFNGGDITLSVSNNCGSALSGRRISLINSTPLTPGLISGSTNACQYMPSVVYPGGLPATYFIRKISRAVSYNWNVPAGALITSHPAGTGADDTVIVVTYSGSFTGGVITVSGNSNCGTGGIRSLVISANLKPGTASAIAAVETQLCPDRQVTYSLASLPVNSNWVDGLFRPTEPFLVDRVLPL